MNLFEHLCANKELFYETKCNKIQMNLLENLYINKKLFYENKRNKI